MPKVKSYATMLTHLKWEGHVPDDVPEDERWVWIKENIDGGDFVEDGLGDWEWGTDVEVIENVCD